MNDYPVMSMSKFQTLLGGLTRRNAGRPGGSENAEKRATSKRVYGPIPGSEQIAALLFYRSSYKPEEVKGFLTKHGMKEFAPRETTPAFYRTRIKKVANFDKNALKTYRLEANPDVLVITGRLLTADEKTRKPTAYEPRIRTLRAAGWNVTSEAERKKAAEEVAKLEERLTKLKTRVEKDGWRPTPTDIKNAASWLKRSAPEGSANKSKTIEEIEYDLANKADSNVVSVAAAIAGRTAIGNLLIEQVKASLSEARRASTRMASAPAGPRSLPEGITEEMLGEFKTLQGKHTKPDSPQFRSVSEIRSLALNETPRFLKRLTELRQKDEEAGGERTSTPPKKPAAGSSAKPAADRDPTSRVDKAAAAALKKVAGVTAKGAVARIAQILDSVVARDPSISDANLRNAAEAMAQVVKRMKAAGVSTTEFTPAQWREYASKQAADAGLEPEEEEEEEIGVEEFRMEENPRRRRPRTAIVPARTAAKWLKLKAVADKVDAAYHKMSKSYDDLRKIADLLGRLKRKRTAQADYARDQLQAEQTRVERRLVKETAAYKKAQATYLKAIKVANKKPKRRSR